MKGKEIFITTLISLIVLCLLGLNYFGNRYILSAKNVYKVYLNGDVIDRAAALEAKTKQTESKILISKRSVKKLDCHVANAPRNDGLVYKDFDEESVELIDVRE